jgi:glucosyl-dolichyl phosphate glucuronosyltransferase
VRTLPRRDDRVPPGASVDDIAPGTPIGQTADRASDQPLAETAPAAIPSRTVNVVIACFDTRRMSLLTQAIQSVREQDYPHRLTVVVDYNEELYRQLLASAPEGVSIIRNTRSRGAAGARNTSALETDCSLVAFLDDDASARAGWLRSLAHAMDRPGVVGVGGRILPRWQEVRPRWFPPEFGWIIGASIAGTDSEELPVRNVWSGNMMVDRKAFQSVNGFREDLSKVGGGAKPEDTELCLRLGRTYRPAGHWLMVPTALVDHYVPAHRATIRYVVDRCWAEGIGKIGMRAIAEDRKLALSEEKLYLTKTIPQAVGAGILQSLRHRNADGAMRAGTIVVGIAAAFLGALMGAVCLMRANIRWISRHNPEPRDAGVPSITLNADGGPTKCEVRGH